MALSVLILGVEGDWGLMGSYGRGFKNCGANVHYWDLGAAVERYARLGPLGRTFSQFVPVEAWALKANRDLINKVIALSPDLLVWAGADVRAGAIAQIKVARPNTKVVLVWPDTLLNLSDRLIECSRVADLVAAYSSGAVVQFERLGARKVVWTPFAVDGELFPSSVETSSEERRKFICDVSFIGNFRPEREQQILRLLDAGVAVKVWAAHTWPKLAKDKSQLERYFQGGPLLGAEMVKAMRCSTLALNLIDPMNFPGANMRVFETYACGATPLCSRCPEIEPVFPEGKSAFYFDDDSLVAVTKELLRDPVRIKAVGEHGRDQALAGHTYAHRAQAILDAVS